MVCRNSRLSVREVARCSYYVDQKRVSCRITNILKIMFSPTRLGSPIALLIPPYLRLISSDMTAALFLAELVRIVSGILFSVESCF